MCDKDTALSLFAFGIKGETGMETPRWTTRLAVKEVGGQKVGGGGSATPVPCPISPRLWGRGPCLTSSAKSAIKEGPRSGDRSVWGKDSPGLEGLSSVPGCTRKYSWSEVFPVLT